MSDDIVVGSVAVDIVPDTKNFRRDLNAKLQGITADIGVNADLAGIRADLDEVTRPRDVRVVANADVAEAEAQLDETARDRTTKIRANVDRSEVNSVGKMSNALGNIGVLGTSIITLGPALIPILGTIAAIGLALGAPIAVAAGGATVFGFLAGFALKDTGQQLKAIDQARAKLGTLTKGTAQYAAAQADLKAKQDALSPAQKKYAAALDNIKGTFATLLGGKVGDQLLGPVAAFLTLAADVLPKLTPIIGAVSGALTTLIDDLGNSVKGPEFKAFITAFTRQVGPDIVAFGRIAGNVFKGVAGLVISLGNAFGPSVLKGLGSLAGKFADLGQQAQHSQKLQDFVDYFHRVGPQVGQTIGEVARAVGHVVSALAPLGPASLAIIRGIAKSISAIPVPVLTGLAGAFIAMTVAAKVGKGLDAITSLGGLGGRSGLVSKFLGSTKPVPVFVTNPGGIGGVEGGAGKKGFLAGLLGKELPGALGVAGLTAGTAAAWAAAGAAVGLAAAKGNQIASPSHRIIPIANHFFFTGNPSSGALSPDQVQSGIDLRRADIPRIRSTTTNVDALRASLDKASRTIDQIGPHADNAFGQASKDVDRFGSKLAAIHDKKVRVILDDIDAVRDLEVLQAYRLRNKTLTINIEQELERAVGPGGGRGRPTGSGGSGGGATRADAPRIATSPRTATSSTSPIHVDKMFLTDTNDVLRKADRQVRNRAGGGVTFPPPLVSSFAGAQ